ncbi:MAG: hypothetical protein ABH814_03655 [bacterium]
MESLSSLKIYKKLQNMGLKFVDYALLAQLVGLDNKRKLYELTRRLQRNGVLEKMVDGKFLVSGSLAVEFEIANYAYQPSYVSLESALSYYGILSQFPYTITSVSTRKTRKVTLRGKEYWYCRINPSLYWGYEKAGGFLIAGREKALLDTLYFHSKGLANLDISELDLSLVNRQELKRQATKFGSRLVSAKIKEIIL